MRLTTRPACPIVMPMRHGRPASLAKWISAAALSASLVQFGGTPADPPHALSARMARLPRLTVWAWERREDLRELDPQTTALAYLDRTVVLDSSGMTVIPRRQPMLLPASAALVRISVLRIEVAAGTPLTDVQAEAVADRAAEAANATHPAAL